MSITDELREWKSKITTRRTPEEVLTLRCEINCIADRIDAELEGYIELPKDADGVPIRIGDKMMQPNGNIREVEAIGIEGFVAWSPDGKRYAFYASDISRHVQSDSWERIIEDAQADGVRYHNEGKPSDFFALVERCKRLAGERA